MDKDKGGGSSGIDGYLFRLIATFEAAAMQQLGKIAHPLTGDVEVDLAGASDSIEMLSAIQRKTEGNLNEDERRLLEHVLFQLRMNYVDVSKERTASGATPDGGGATEDAAHGPESAAASDNASREPGGSESGAGDGEDVAEATPAQEGDPGDEPPEGEERQ